MTIVRTNIEEKEDKARKVSYTYATHLSLQVFELNPISNRNVEQHILCPHTTLCLQAKYARSRFLVIQRGLLE